MLYSGKYKRRLYIFSFLHRDFVVKNHFIDILSIEICIFRRKGIYVKGYEEIANSGILWLITFSAIALVLFQVIVFLKKSFSAGKKMGLEKKTLHTAFKVGAVSAIGPSMVVVIGMVSLLIVVGGPTALMRLAYIGNVAYELLAAEFAADAYGVTISDPNLPPEVFSVTLWCMAFGCIGWIVVTALFTDKMEKVKTRLSKGSNASKLIPAISTAAMLGAYGYLTAGYAIGLDANTVALLSGFFVMLVIIFIYKKKKIKWLNEWGLTIAMVSGVCAAAFF